MSRSQGSWGSGTGQVNAVALADAAGAAAWIDATEIAPADETALAAWLADADQPKALHDAKGPMLALAARGWPLRGLAADTALSAYLSHPDQRSYDLADLTLRYLHRELKGAEAATDQLTLDLDGDSAAGAGRRCRRPTPSSTWLPRSRPSWRRAAARSCSPRSSCRWSTCSRGWSRPASPSTWTT